MRREKIKFFLILLPFFLFLLLSGLILNMDKADKAVSFRVSSPLPQQTPTERATLLRVIDGDTLLVKIGKKQEKVRLIGIDCPEKGEPFAKKARNFTRRLAEGKEVWLYRDVSHRDSYGRLLRYVYVNRVFLNAELVARGYAKAVAYPPDLKYFSLFLQLEKEAREQKRGIYGKLIEP